MERPQLASQYLGKEGEDPTAPPWASGNYVGPYWSNGKLQESVEWGEKDPVHALDELARAHDAAYAHFKDEEHREAADMIFAEEARKLKKTYGPKWADDPKVAARFVEYGNFTARQAKKLAGSVLKPSLWNLLGPIGFQVRNMLDNNKRMQGTYLKTELSDVRKFHGTDPKLVGRRVVSPSLKEDALQQPVAGSGKKVSPADDPKKTSGWGKIFTGGATSKNTPRFEHPPLVRQRANIQNLAAQDEVIQRQATRFRDYKALHDAALASRGQPHVYHKPKLNVKKAVIIPKKKKTKRTAVRPL